MNPILFLKAQVKGHTRQVGARIVYVAPYSNRLPSAVPSTPTVRSGAQGDLFSLPMPAVPGPTPPTAPPKPPPPAMSDAEAETIATEAFLAHAARVRGQRNPPLVSYAGVLGAWQHEGGRKRRLSDQEETAVLAAMARLAQARAAAR